MSADHSPSNSKVYDYLDHPPQRYRHQFQKASGSREMVADGEGEWVKFEDMDLYMLEGGELMKQMAAENEKLKLALGAALKGAIRYVGYACADCGMQVIEGRSICKVSGNPHTTPKNGLEVKP